MSLWSIPQYVKLNQLVTEDEVSADLHVSSLKRKNMACVVTLTANVAWPPSTVRNTTLNYGITHSFPDTFKDEFFLVLIAFSKFFLHICNNQFSFFDNVNLYQESDILKE